MKKTRALPNLPRPTHNCNDPLTGYPVATGTTSPSRTNKTRPEKSVASGKSIISAPMKRPKPFKAK
jgi:hypothetical protein